jgi:hypothetical protein
MAGGSRQSAGQASPETLFLQRMAVVALALAFLYRPALLSLYELRARQRNRVARRIKRKPDR